MTVEYSDLTDCPTCPMLATDRDDALGELRAAEAELERLRPIVDAVVARHQHRATYPARHDHADLDSYAAATEAWLIADHNLGRAITRAAEAHLGCVDDGWQTGTEQADTGSPA